MSDAAELSDRHLRAADGLSDNAPQRGQFVRIVVSPKWSGTCSGQLLVSCLVNLLCRQIGAVDRIEIAASASSSRVRLPFDPHGEHFPENLVGFSKWAVNGITPISAQLTSAAADQTIFVGRPDADAHDIQNAVVAIGDGWCAWIGDPNAAPHITPSESANPLGPFFAAALAAGEVFKRARGIARGRYLTADGYSLWSYAKHSDWNALQQGPDLAGHSLGAVHVVGAGAVGNAVAYLAIYLGLGKAYFIFVDDDTYDRKNLNRCLLAGWQDLSAPKADQLAATLNSFGVAAYGFPGTIAAYVVNSDPGLRTDVRNEVNNLNFEIVLSCVDKGKSRQDIQGIAPKLLIGGSTVDLQAKAILYPKREGAACLACFNPAERDADKMRAVEKQLGEMGVEEKQAFLTQNGLDVAAVEEYLSKPHCGGMGEAALRDFATKSPPQFSVGFVSLAAGILLAATLFRQTLFRPEAPAVRDMSSFNFLNGGMLDSNLGHDPNCERKCQSQFTIG